MLMGSTPMRTAPSSHKFMTGPSHPIRDALKVASEESHEENNQNFSTPKFSSMLARVERTPTSIQSSSMSINTTRSEIVRSPLKTPLRILNLPKFEDSPDEEVIPDSQEASRSNKNMKLHNDSQPDEFNEFDDEKNNLEEVNDNLMDIHLQEEHSALFQFERTPRKPKTINELSLETAVEEMEGDEVTSIDPSLVMEYSDPPKNKEIEHLEQEYPEPPSFSVIVNSSSVAVSETPRKSINNNYAKEQHQSFKDFPEIALIHPSPGAPAVAPNHDDSIIFSYGDDGGFNGHEEGEEDHRPSETCEDSESNEGSLLFPEEQEKIIQLGRDSDSDDEEVPRPKKPRVTKLSVSLGKFYGIFWIYFLN